MACIMAGLPPSAWADPPDPEPIHESVSALITQFSDGIARSHPPSIHVLFGNLFRTVRNDAVASFSIEGFNGSNDYASYLAFFAAVRPQEAFGRTSRPYRLVAVSKIGGKVWRTYDWKTAVIEDHAVKISGKKVHGGWPRIEIVSTFRVENSQLVEVTEEVIGHGRDDQAYFAKPSRGWMKPIEDEILAWVREKYPEFSDQIDHLRSDSYQHCDLWLSIGYESLPDHLALPGLPDDDLKGPEIQSPHLKKGGSWIYVNGGKIAGIMVHGVGAAGGFPEDLGAFSVRPSPLK